MLGIREYARDGGAGVQSLDLELGLEGVACAGNCGCRDRSFFDEETQERGLGKPPPDRARSCSCCCRGDGGQRGNGECVLADGRDDTGTGPVAGVASAPASSANGGENADPDVDAGGTSDDGHGNGGDGLDGGDAVHHLFAFPAECNATGLRPDLGIAARVKQGALSVRGRYEGCGCGGSGGLDAAGSTCNGGESGRGGDEPVEAGERCRRRRHRRRRRPPEERWWVLLDAAKLVGTESLDLSRVEADFVALSFYKMFG